MFKKLSSPLQQTILYGFSVVLMRGLSFFMLPFVVGVLSPSEFGLLELLTTVAIIASVFMSFGVEHALYRFVGAEQEATARAKIFSQVYSLCIVLCCIALFAAPILAGVASTIVGQAELRSVFLLIFVSLSFETLISVPLAWLRMNDRSMAFCWVALQGTALRAAAVVLFLTLDHGVAAIFEAGVFASVTNGMVLLFLLRKDFSFRWDTKSVKSYLRYGIPIMGSGLLAFGLSGLDRWLLAGQISLEQLAIYAIGMKFALLLCFSMQPYGMWYMPKRLDILKHADGIAKSQVYSQMGIHLTLFLALGIGLTAPLFIQWFLPPVYSAVIPYIPLFLAWAALKEMSEFVVVGCLAGNGTHKQFKIQLVATLLGVCVMCLLIEPLAEWGVLCGLIIAHIVRFGWFYTISQSELRLHLPLRRFGILAAFSFILVTLQAIKVERNTFEDITFIVLAIGVYGLAASLLFHLQIRLNFAGRLRLWIRKTV